MIRITANNKPLISVIIPAYNEEQYIRACLTALLNQQTTVRYEIIVVNNNSTDQTVAIANTFGVRVIVETKKGASAARNTGVRHAHGDIMVFVDADCVVPANHLELICHEFIKNPSLHVLAGPYIHTDGGRIVRWITKDAQYFTNLYKIMKVIFGVQGFGSGNVAIKKSTYMKLGGFNEAIDDVVKAEDLELAIRMYKAKINIIYNPTLITYASFRRIKRAPYSTTILRSYYALSQLLRISRSM